MNNAILFVLLALGLASCGGDENAFGGGAGGGGGGSPQVEVSAMALVTDSPSLASDGSSSAKITAYVKDANNNLMEGVLVQFAASSGSLAVTQATTDSNGAATAILTTADNSENRTITVTATARAISGTVDVAVSGTTIDIQGPDTLLVGVQGDYTAIVTNSAGAAIPGARISLEASSGSLSASSVTADGNGRASFTLAPAAAGEISLKASGAGAAKTRLVAVGSDRLVFTTPVADKQVKLDEVETFTVNWQTSGAPIPDGSQVEFSTTRGTLSSSSAVTVGGQASVTLQSTSAGEAVVTARSVGGVVQRRVYFVATTAASVDLQASSFAVPINGSSLLTATVRDAANNLVANKTVKFELADSTGGSLTTGSAVTDLRGRATAVYNASQTSSALGGVIVTATVTNPNPTDPQPPVLPSDTVELTVAGTASSIVFGTGNKVLSASNNTLYQVDYTALVKDITGAGIANLPVTITVEPDAYRKGGRRWVSPRWVTEASTLPGVDFCDNEDTNLNGLLDATDNDENQNGTLQPGGVVIVKQTQVTDANGFLPFSITYPQDHTEYVRVRLRARATVQGSEFESTTQPFWLPGAATDFSQEGVPPPGLVSPFGIAGSCTDPD